MAGLLTRFALRSLRQRIILLFVLLLVLIQATALLFITTANNNIARSTIDEALAQGERVFQRVLQQNQTRLEQGVTILSGDFAFRTAIATNDRGTIDSVLRNHGARVNADVMLLVGLDQIVRVDTLAVSRTGQAFEFPVLIEQAVRDGKASTITKLDAQLYQLVVVPVLAPEAIAWVAMGFRIDDATAREFKQLSGLDVSFASHAAAGAWRLHASTLDQSRQQDLAKKIQGTSATALPTEVQLLDAVFETRVLPLAKLQTDETIVVLQRPLDSALAPFRQIERTVLWLTLGGIIIAVIGSFAIARKITQPINALAQSAKRMETGDYAQPIKIDQADEIGALAASLDHMRDGIASREQQILKLAFEDGLTGLPNRTMFMRHLDQAVSVAQRGGASPIVMLLDLDRFKTINDVLGHAVGDIALTEVGKRLRDALRDSDNVARLGGDEFAVLLTTGHVDTIDAIVRKILSSLEQPIVIDNQQMDVGASIGIAHYPAHGDDSSALLRAADIAMYAAKRSKSGSMVFDPRSLDQRESHLSLLSELRRAVEQDQLVLFYQPKLSLAALRTTGAEALVRWQHPDKGLIMPNDFIPFAEQTGFIATITHWVINAAVKQCGLWHAAGLSLHVAINVSARDLQVRDDLAGLVATALARHAVPPALICIEITESALMHDRVGAMATLQRLHDMGVSLSIDDYGSGYSSLAYLKQLAVNELKIDRAFVVGMETDQKNLAIIRSTIELGHNLGLSVTAEGVETTQELEQLRQMGCDLAQGYRIGRPMTPQAFEQWLTSGEFPLA